MLRAQARKGLVCGCPDCDVIGMPEHAVGAKRDDHGWILIVENAPDRRDDVFEGHVRDASVGQAEPLMTIRHAAERAPCGFVLGAADEPERLAGCRESVPDITLFAGRGVYKDEPEISFVRV